MLTLWPPLYFVLFICFMAFTFASIGQSSKGSPQSFNFFMVIFPLHLLTMILMFALTAVYVIHAFRSDEIPEQRRVLWVIILFFGNMLAFPIYWWLYLRPSRSAGTHESAQSQVAPR